MSRQEMDYDELNRDRPGPSYGGYEGTYHPNSHMYGGKLTVSAVSTGTAPTAGQRLALAIVSLAMLMVVIFGLIAIAVATEAPNWVIIPILFIMTLFAVAAIMINTVFNRKA